LKDKIFKNSKGFTDSDDEFIGRVKEMLENGTIAKKTAQLIKKELEKTQDPLQVLQILGKHIRLVHNENNKINVTIQKREVILSGYIIK
jgi:hypothetical protein